MEGLFGNIQENVQTLAAFSERGCPIVRNSVPSRPMAAASIAA